MTWPSSCYVVVVLMRVAFVKTEASYNAVICMPFLACLSLSGRTRFQAWAVVGALGGLLGLWALIIAFFLLYSPFYLIGKLPRFLGRGGWLDWREVRFYLSCFGLLCVLAALAFWEPAVGLTAFAVAASCGPLFWRVLV